MQLLCGHKCLDRGAASAIAGDEADFEVRYLLSSTRSARGSPKHSRPSAPITRGSCAAEVQKPRVVAVVVRRMSSSPTIPRWKWLIGWPSTPLVTRLQKSTSGPG